MKRSFFILLLLCVGVFETKAQQMDKRSWHSRLVQGLDSLCHGLLTQISQLGLMVVDASTGKQLYAYNPHHRMRPASCQKLVTSIAALHYLGEGHKVNSDLWLTGQLGMDSVLRGDVYAVGRMDAMLSQGDVYRMANALRQAGVDSIAGRIYMDLSYRDSVPLGWGWCWDDEWGPMSALTVDAKDSFACELVMDLRTVGIGLADSIVGQAMLPVEAHPVMQVTHTIRQMLVRTMKKSDNIYAESIFQQLASMDGTPWAGRKQAARRIGRLMKQLGVADSCYQIADGSGLSLYNYITPHTLVSLLQYAWNTPRLRNALLPTLPVAGVDGTLERRMRRTAAKGRIKAKTGTVQGVSSLAGYATAADGRTLIFCIINQGAHAGKLSRNFQDKVCELLCKP